MGVVDLSVGRDGLTARAQMEHPDPWQVTEYVDVIARARELGCRAPVGVALLPGNFATAAGADELRYNAAAPQVRSAWRSVGLIDTGPRQDSRGAGSAVPAQVPLVVFFGRGVADDSRRVLSALTMVAWAITSIPGPGSAREFRFDVIVERPSGDGYACIRYDGDAREIIDLRRGIERVRADI